MFGPGAFIFGVVIPVAVVALVAYGVWELARSRGPQPAVDGAGVTGGSTASGTARSILDERFARGEVDAEEYVRRRALLDGTVPSPPQAATLYTPPADPAASEAGAAEAAPTEVAPTEVAAQPVVPDPPALAATTDMAAGSDVAPPAAATTQEQPPAS